METKQKTVGRPIKNKEIGKLDKIIIFLGNKNLFSQFKKISKKKKTTFNSLLNEVM